MNQEKIGKFIAESRKNAKLTQAELAEKLGVTEKSISNWENGRNMPDLALFKPLCDELGITINDFMSGEKIDEEKYQEKLEENIVNTIDFTNKKLTTSNTVFGTTLLVIGFVIILTAIAIFPSESSWGSIYSIFGAIVSLVGFAMLTRKVGFQKRAIWNLGFLVIVISMLFVLDYINVKLNDEAPMFRIKTVYVGDVIFYDTPFYDVYRCHFDTDDEYWKIEGNGKQDDGSLMNYCK